MKLKLALEIEVNDDFDDLNELELDDELRFKFESLGIQLTKSENYKVIQIDGTEKELIDLEKKAGI